MNIVIAQGPESNWHAVLVEHGDDYHVPSLIVLSRCLDLYNTVLYDCLELGAPFEEVKAMFKLGSKYTEDHIREWVREHGRVVIDSWTSLVGWEGHTEPVEQVT